MKTKGILLLLIMLLASCSDETLTDEFNDANGNDNENNSGVLITKVEVVSIQDPLENQIVFINYDGDDRVSSVSNGGESSVLVYNNGELTNVTNQGETLNVEELYNSPYDAFETGQVLEYDNNGNPIKVMFFEEEYDENTNTYSQVEYTAEFYYDDEPNPYFYTLDAAGVIDVLDDVQLNFSINPQSPDLVQARMLFPLNNINRIVYKDEFSAVLFEILADYVYNDDNHPSTATVTGSDAVNNETSVYTVAYTYKQ